MQMYFLWINHDQQIIYYKFPDLPSVPKNFYAILAKKELYRNCRGLRSPLTELWDYDTFVGSINTEFDHYNFH